MTIATQKRRELAWIRETQSYGEIPPGNLTDSEAPDALLISETTTIGIEVTEYVRGRGAMGGSKLRAIENDAWKFARDAQTLFGCGSDLPLFVTFGWNGHLLPRGKPERDAIVSEMVDTIRKHVPQEEMSALPIPEWQLWSGPLHRYVHSIFVMKQWAGSYPHWAPCESGAVGCTPTEIQSCIDEKQLKLWNYRANCDQVYLLIVAEGSHVSTHPGDTTEVREHFYRSGFDRVLFLDRVQRHVAPLNFEVTP